MENEEIGEYSPEEVFDSGVLTGEELAKEQLAEQLAGQGFDESEIHEALYADGTDVFRPRKGRKGGKRHCSAKQLAKMPQICSNRNGAKRYDPAPRRSRSISVATASGARKIRKGRKPILVYDPAPKAKRSYTKRAKGLLGKLKPYALPGSAAVTFYAGYVQRTKDMEADPVTFKNDDGTPVKGMFQAIMWDINHFNSSDAMTRIQDNATSIIAPAVLGYGVKEFKLGGKYSSLAGDILMGLAAGTAAKTILDPPAPQNQFIAQQAQARTAQQNAAQIAAIQAQNNVTQYADTPVYQEQATLRSLPIYAQEN